MDSFGTGSKERHPVWFLGMQCDRQLVDVELLRDLPEGFRRRVMHGDASSHLPAEPLFSLHTPGTPASREYPEATGIALPLHNQ